MEALLMRMNIVYLLFGKKRCAEGGNRTHTGLCIPLDFESSASSSSATPALWDEDYIVATRRQNLILSPGNLGIGIIP